MTAATPTTTSTPSPQEQSKALLTQAAGYVGHRTIAMGLRSGLVAALAARPGATAADLADALDFDDFYVSVWCRSALAAGVVERAGRGYRLAPHLDGLLLDTASPAYVGGLFAVMQQREMFDRFEESLASGERLWWDECSPEWISSVAAAGGPFYARLVPGGLAQVPGLAERLDEGCRIADTACGAGGGVVRLAQAYPACEVVGVDGDAHSLATAEQRCADAGVSDRVSLVHSPLEDFRLDDPATVVINNISMHECRDIDRVTENVKAALEPGGWFVISDFPFPDTDEGLQSVPGRIMAGIQFLGSSE